jgi:hypothetical protein
MAPASELAQAGMHPARRTHYELAVTAGTIFRTWFVFNVV